MIPVKLEKPYYKYGNMIEVPPRDAAGKACVCFSGIYALTPSTVLASDFLLRHCWKHTVLQTGNS